MFVLAKVLEALGCADVGFALYIGLTRSHSMGKELEIMAIGIVVFMLGYLVERFSGARS